MTWTWSSSSRCLAKKDIYLPLEDRMGLPQVFLFYYHHSRKNRICTPMTLWILRYSAGSQQRVLRVQNQALGQVDAIFAMWAGGGSCDVNRERHEKDRHRVKSTPKHEVASLLNVITTAAKTAEEPAVHQDTAMDRVVDSNEIRRQRC